MILKVLHNFDTDQRIERLRFERQISRAVEVAGAKRNSFCSELNLSVRSIRRTHSVTGSRQFPGKVTATGANIEYPAPWLQPQQRQDLGIGGRVSKLSKRVHA